MTDVGELFVGAYLDIVEKCDVVNYNVRTKNGGKEGLSELDVIGINFSKSTVYLCEVTTHLLGLNYGSNQKSVEKIKSKHKWQREYAEKYLSQFENIKYMFWSPIVPNGYMTEEFEKLREEDENVDLEFIINAEYTKRFNCLLEVAQNETQDRGNDFFRMLQIQTHLKQTGEVFCPEVERGK